MSITTLLAEPAGYRCLHEAIGDTLAWLGQDEDQILQALHAGGLPGWPGHPDMDPLVRWLGQSMPDVAVRLSGGGLLASAGGDVALVPLPPAVAGALARLARGEEPRLVLQLDPPAELPGPDPDDVYGPAQLDPPAPPELVDLPFGTEVIPAAERVPDGPADPSADDAPTVVVPAPAWQYDTVVTPVTSVDGARAYERLAALRLDAGSVPVRVAAICGLAAVAAFALALEGALLLVGTAVGLALPLSAALLLRRQPPQQEYAPRHQHGVYRPAHARAGCPTVTGA